MSFFVTPTEYGLKRLGGTEVITKEQFELAVEIKHAQDQLKYWETVTNWHNPEDKAGYANHEQSREISLEMYREKLTELTGNPRGFLA